jgi:hypothetical protein
MIAILLTTSPLAKLWQGCGGEGGRMAGTVQMPCESAVTEMDQNTFVGSSSENGTTMLQFDLRKLDSLHFSQFVARQYWWKH